MERFLERAEREIEQRTGRSWGITDGRKITDYETTDYEYHDLLPAHSATSIYSYIHKPRIRLKHRLVRVPFATAKSDELEVWSGSSWVEWVGTKTEDRNADFFINGDEGIIYFMRGYPMFRHPDGIRVRYRYGHTVVDPWVEDIATKMAALMVLENFKQYAMTAEQTARVPWEQTSRAWREEIEKKLDEESWNRDKAPMVL